MKSDTLTKTLVLNGSPETVWSFLTEADKLGLWYHPAESDFREGESYALRDTGEDGTSSIIVWGDVLEMKRPHRLVCTFTIKPLDGRKTTLTWQLDEVAGGTRLTLTHEGIDEAAGAAALGLLGALDKGWDKHFGSLRDVAA